MALVLADRVRETTTTTGTGTISLGGPVSGFQGFSTAIGNANTTYYTIADAATGAWEVGLGTYTSSGSTLARTTVLSSSNAGAAVNFAAGTKDVFVTQPAERALYLNGAGTGVDAGAAAFTANGVVYASSTSALATGSALTFDGTTFGVTSSVLSVILLGDTGSAADQKYWRWQYGTGVGAGLLRLRATNDANTDGQNAYIIARTGINVDNHQWLVSGTEQARLTSSGLEIKQSQLIGYSSYAGIGTNGLAVAGNVGVGIATPAYKLDVVQDANSFTGQRIRNNDVGASAYAGLIINANGNSWGMRMGSGAANSNALELVLDALGTPAIKATLNNAGNLGLGVTPSAWDLIIQAFELKNSAYIGGQTDTTPALYAGANAFYSGGGWKYKTTNPATNYISSNGSHLWYTAPSGTAGAAISFTQAMTLDASGILLVGKTSAGIGNIGVENLANGAVYSSLVGSTGATSSYNLYSTGASAYRFYVDMAGTVFATSIVISAISDQRLKENVRDIDAGLDQIMALKPRRFDWKKGKGQDKKNVAGFIAQEFEEVFPECVGVTKAGGDGIEYKNINHETLIPALVKAIQEQQTLITALTARITALESSTLQ
jgi:hypothetical protein